MSRVCQITGKRALTGNHVSHANNKSRRRYLPNLQAHRFWIPSQNRWIRMRVSTAALRLIDKQGVEKTLQSLGRLTLKP